MYFASLSIKYVSALFSCDLVDDTIASTLKKTVVNIENKYFILLQLLNAIHHVVLEVDFLTFYLLIKILLKMTCYKIKNIT